MKICHTRELMNPFFPSEMEGYSEQRFMLNQTEEQKKEAGDTERIARGIRDDLLLDTLLIESNHTVVFFTLDMIIAEKRFVDYCKDRIVQDLKMSYDNICISCTHTHNSPLTSYGMDDNLKPDLGYWEELADKMIYSIRLAKKHLQPAKVFLDDFKIQGYYNNRNRPQEEYFNHCLDLTFTTVDNIPLVRLLNLACHPSLIGVQNKYYTADFFGVMRRYIQGINGTPVMIFNGEAGDVSPRLLKKGVDWNECVRYGEGIGSQLIYPNHPQEIAVEELKITKIHHVIDYDPQKESYLHHQKELLQKQLQELNVGSKEYELVSSCYLYDIDNKLSGNPLHYEADCYVYDFGGFRIVTVPCEIDTVLGKLIREQDEKPTILNAYANGFLYYAVNKEEYGKVFESYVTYFPYGSADNMVDKIISSYSKDND